MQAFRPLLRRNVRRGLDLRQVVFPRAQHNFQGPHKEYFQTPGQNPLPDTTPYTHVEPPSHPTIEAPPINPGRSLFSRAGRSLFWATFFGVSGVVAGTALITWEYLQPPFEPGSEEEADLYEEILETLDTSSLVEGLKEDQWVEETFYTGRLRGATGVHLVKEKLTGTQGITIKTFKHASQKYTMMVAFLGFGIEGWPDVVHGGIITTLLQESVDRHIRTFYQDLGEQDSHFISVDFKAPTRPGNIYAILVPPAGVESDIFGRKQLHLFPMLMRMEVAPILETEYDNSSHTERFVIRIPTPSAQDVTHAAATVRVRMVRKQKENESTAGTVADENP